MFVCQQEINIKSKQKLKEIKKNTQEEFMKEDEFQASEKKMMLATETT